MDKPDLEVELHFSQPVRQVVLMLAVLVLSIAGAVLAAPRVLPVFQSNPYLNGFILLVFVIGVLATFYQVAQMVASVRWVTRFAQSTDHAMVPPRILAPLATLLARRDRRMQITTTSTRSILDSVATRIDEAREITRYIVSLLIFLGLLGTFYGLATTVPALVETIRSLAPSEGESGIAVFSRLMSGLESQLDGMGVAFASSLLGLACSLIVGLLELFAGHGQNRFYRELEEWLSSITRIGFSSDSEGPDLGAAGVVLDRMAEQMAQLEYLFAQSEKGRSEVDARLTQLAGSLERLSSQIEQNSPSAASLARIAEGQDNLADAIREKETAEGLDAESRMRLRSIDVQMLRILEELAAGRQESMTELRTEMTNMTRALQQIVRLAGGGGSGQGS